jgi:hypothetical protein
MSKRRSRPTSRPACLVASDPDAPELRNESARDRFLRLAADMPFGAWLVTQKDRPGYIGDLARTAARDRSFPTRGASRQVFARVLSQVWDEDTLTALEDALTEWRTLIARAVKAGERPTQSSMPCPPHPAPGRAAAAPRP